MIGKWAFNAPCDCGKVHDLHQFQSIKSARLTIKCDCGRDIHVEPRLGSWRLPKVIIRPAAA